MGYKIFKTTIYLLIGFLAMELFFQFNLTVRPTITTYDEKFGSRPKSDFLWVKFKEGFYIGRTSADGLLSTPSVKSTGNHTLRIGLIGDSFVAGDDVLPRHHFGSVLARNVNGKYGRGFAEVFNFGRGNFSIASSYFYYDQHARQFNLDYLFYFLEARDYGVGAPPYVSYYRKEGDELVRAIERSGSLKYFVFKFLGSSRLGLIIGESAILAMLSRSLHGFEYDKIFGKFSSWRELLLLEKPVLRPDWVESTRRGQLPEFTKEIIEKLSAANNPKVIFVTRHHPVKVPDIDRYLADKGARFITLSSIVDGTTLRATGEDVHYFSATQSYGGHFNRAGHNAIGKYLAEEFIALYGGEVSPR